jgi:hypothetical protein
MKFLSVNVFYRASLQCFWPCWKFFRLYCPVPRKSLTFPASTGRRSLVGDFIRCLFSHFADVHDPPESPPNQLLEHEMDMISLPTLSIFMKVTTMAELSGNLPFNCNLPKSLFSGLTRLSNLCFEGIYIFIMQDRPTFSSTPWCTASRNIIFMFILYNVFTLIWLNVNRFQM